MQALPPLNPSERIIRGLFSPLNLHKKTGKLLPNFYTLRIGEDGVSVLRPDISSVDACRKHFKAIENPDPKMRRSYFGIALLYADEILETKHENCTINIIPKEDKYRDYTLFQHAEMYYFINGEHFVPAKRNDQVGVELHPYIAFMAEKLVEITLCFPDPDLASDTWVGNELIKQGRNNLTSVSFNHTTEIYDI